MPNKKNISYSNFTKRVNDAINQYDMIKKGSRVLVCVSGGADSVCLLKTLLALKKKLLIEIVVANLDHGIRGEESEKESEFVKDLCRKDGVLCVHKKIKVLAGKNSKISIEEKARKERYKFFYEAAEEYGCEHIATGHTMDDQAENVIMRVIYGGSISGVAGIPPVRNEKGYKIIRPLIRVSRKEILHFLKKLKQRYVKDSSNKDVNFIRNKVRLKLLPLLEKYNPSVRRNLINLSDSLREDLELISSCKEQCKKNIAGETVVEIKDIILQPKALRRDIFKAVFINAGGDVKKLNYRHWMDLDLFIRTAEKGKTIDLPGKIRAIKTSKHISFEKNI